MNGKPFSGTIDPNCKTTRSDGRTLLSDVAATYLPHGWSREAIADLVARQTAADAAMMVAFARCPAGLTGLAQTLAMYDGGWITAEDTVERMRSTLGIDKPVIAGSAELSQDMAALYRGLPPGTASVSAPGG